MECLIASGELSGSTRLLFNEKEVPGQNNCCQEFRERFQSLSTLAREKKKKNSAGAYVWLGRVRQCFPKLAESASVAASIYLTLTEVLKACLLHRKQSENPRDNVCIYSEISGVRNEIMPQSRERPEDLFTADSSPGV